MPEFQILSRPKLEEIHHELGTYFYKRNINVGLEHALQSTTFYDFTNDVQITLKHQVYPFTKKANIEEIFNKVGKVSDRDWVTAISVAFVTFSDAFPLGEKALLYYLIWAATQGGRDALSKLGASDTHFNPNSDYSRKILNDRLSFLSPQVDQTTMLWIAGLLTVAADKGMDATDASLFINSQMDDMVLRRGNVIAETETANAFGEFQLETFKKNGVQNVRWVTAHDERTCPICMGNEDQGAIPIGELFSSGKSAPPAHILCRCYLMNDDDGTEITWRG